ncbi:hypothetical protein BSR28_07130 [Boudabousia liubingyangii]|uniref:hypothetical protein n=1 Tax=Boudabousia liubingyangii TaxID=1921764 RepID=UPI00093B67AB|nr:hypothetical protein [Boudabousia liubingyangii]OKL46304.1 hypothetical protein BSR28_07130 [Boudabousia liubingyangii]
MDQPHKLTAVQFQRYLESEGLPVELKDGSQARFLLELANQRLTWILDQEPQDPETGKTLHPNLVLETELAAPIPASRQQELQAFVADWNADNVGPTLHWLPQAADEPPNDGPESGQLLLRGRLAQVDASFNEEQLDEFFAFAMTQVLRLAQAAEAFLFEGQEA